LGISNYSNQNIKPVWRLIPFLKASGSVQMAIDCWLLEQHKIGKHPPVLRFYTWESPTISLGYHQRRWSASWQQITWEDLPLKLVRRPTGGRAVLHQGDLTYMVVMSGLSGTRLQAYQRICQFLIEGWRSLNLTLDYGIAGRDYIHNPNCFGTATGADLVDADGYKLIGSAQLRRDQAILQHGSMRLSPNLELFTKVFGEAAPSPVSLVIKQQGDELIDTVVEALTKAAVECFGIKLINQPLSDLEWHEILLQPRFDLSLENSFEAKI
jgi:lipoate---protein ligase